MPKPHHHADELHLKLSLIEINLLLEALGKLPFERVHELIRDIQNQAQQQLQSGQPVHVPNSPLEDGMPSTTTPRKKSR